MKLHRLASLPLVALAFASVVLSGCSPTPAPTPTPTAAFASEEEAFAAAEETYRAYNEALNSIDPADPETFEAVFAHTTGDFQAADRKNLSTMHAERLSVTGENRVIGFLGLDTDARFARVSGRVCVDVSSVQIKNPAGESQVNPDRPPTYVIDVTFIADERDLLISSAKRSGASTCES